MLAPVARPAEAVSSVTRYVLQAGFLVLTVVAVFYVGANAEQWCPFGGVEALYTYVREGNLPCSLGVSNFYILAAVLGMTLLARRAFCSHVCPLGTIYEWAYRAGRRMGLRDRSVPARLDRILSLGKYLVLGAILFFTYRTSELVFRGYDPCYALLSRHGEDITMWAYVVAGATLAGAVVVRLPFCRWLCPLAAVLQPLSRIGLTRIRRDTQTCIDCGECGRACLMGIPVHQHAAVTDACCTSCRECVRRCPIGQGQTLKLATAGTPRGLSGGAVAAIVLICVGAAVAGATLAPAPSFTYVRGAPGGDSDGDPQGEPVTVELRLEELGCRGRANLLVFFLDRDDEYALPGYLRLEAWPGPGESKVRITVSADGGPGTSAAVLTALTEAITEPYFNLIENRWYPSPFVILPPPP